jgi:hypothetical protein
MRGKRGRIESIVDSICTLNCSRFLRSHTQSVAEYIAFSCIEPSFFPSECLKNSYDAAVQAGTIDYYCVSVWPLHLFLIDSAILHVCCCCFRCCCVRQYKTCCLSADLCASSKHHSVTLSDPWRATRSIRQNGSAEEKKQIDEKTDANGK